MLDLLKSLAANLPQPTSQGGAPLLGPQTLAEAQQGPGQVAAVQGQGQADGLGVPMTLPPQLPEPVQALQPTGRAIPVHQLFAEVTNWVPGVPAPAQQAQSIADPDAEMVDASAPSSLVAAGKAQQHATAGSSLPLAAGESSGEAGIGSAADNAQAGKLLELAWDLSMPEDSGR